MSQPDPPFGLTVTATSFAWSVLTRFCSVSLRNAVWYLRPLSSSTSTRLFLVLSVTLSTWPFSTWVMKSE